MSDYTRFHATITLKRNTPEQVKAILRLLMPESNVQPPRLKDRFFACPNWKSIFDDFRVRDTSISSYHDDILYIRSQLENHTKTIEWFLDWIHPYIVDDTSDSDNGWMRSHFLGTMELPTGSIVLIYYTPSGFDYVQIEQTSQSGYECTVR